MVKIKYGQGVKIRLFRGGKTSVALYANFPWDLPLNEQKSKIAAHFSENTRLKAMKSTSFRGKSALFFRKMVPFQEKLLFLRKNDLFGKKVPFFGKKFPLSGKSSPFP